MTYRALYKNVLQKNFMLGVIGLMLLFPTFFIWAGIPFFIVGRFVESIIANPTLVYFSIALSGGILFSLYFLPINLKVARGMAEVKNGSLLSSFLQLEMIWIAVVAVIWSIGMAILFN